MHRPIWKIRRAIRNWSRNTYHWLDIGMWHSIELVEIELVVGTNIDAIYTLATAKSQRQNPSNLPVFFAIMATEEAVVFKNEGNKAFAARDWPTAIDFYTKAIDLDSTQAPYYSNRAQVCSSSAYKPARVTNGCRHTSDPKHMDMP